MSAPPSAHLDLAAIRARLTRAGGQRSWRSLEEWAATPEFEQMVQREFPEGASEWPGRLSRRDFLSLAAASLALAGVSGCTKRPPQEILPYVEQPEQLVLGQPLFYATSMVLGGFATGVLVKSREGHPIKVEGNPKHPSSLGASSVWMQASILDLYDPDRSRTVTQLGEISSWAEFLSSFNEMLAEQKSQAGAGLRFLTETVTSPTLAGQLADLLQRFPKAKWHQFEPINLDNVREGARLAFGHAVATHYRFNQAAVILALDSDFLYTHPERLRYTRDFTDGRRVSLGRNSFNRLYVAEPTPTVTGSAADHRLPVGSSEVEQIARALAGQLAGDESAAGHLAEGPRAWLQAVRKDLEQHRGQGAVIAGEGQSPAVHALVHKINEELGNSGQTVFYTDLAEPAAVNQLASIQELANEMHQGQVNTLFILGADPVYTAPADLNFGQALSKVRRSVHLGLDLNETAALCTWHVPQAHYLESWGDARAFDGTISLLQPLITPLYGGKSAYELLGAFVQQQPVRDDYAIVRAYWRAQGLGPDFELGWRQALHEGLIAGSALPAKEVRVAADLLARLPASEPGVADAVELNFRPDPSLWDGRFANNGWLQECPKPISKLTWDNALLVSPSFAQRHGLKTEDVVHLEFHGRTLLAPVWIMPGQADRSVTLHLGFGRDRVGQVGREVGCNANQLRGTAQFWTGQGLKLSKTGRRHQLVATQTHHQLHSPERQVHRVGTWEQFQSDPSFVQKSIERPKEEETLYDKDAFQEIGAKWGMSIDLTTCIGCNACLVACEVENNIPVVGKDQVSRNREMFWIRVDTYYKGSLDNPAFYHMPVPCMHCEHAPCELVCPTAATVHDHEGLNLQVYNRCVGTRFCSNNCPYKVRRFNFLQYTKYDAANLEPMFNPEVTVRWRGVMEKCTYCLQRISAGRIAAEKENRPIREGEVRTACQQACPAAAIVFGNLNDPKSQLARLKAHPLDYPMLGELNTRPRTTYLAKLENLNPEAPDWHG